MSKDAISDGLPPRRLKHFANRRLVKLTMIVLSIALIVPKTPVSPRREVEE